MRRAIAPIALALIAVASPSVARAGELLGSLGAYGEEQVSYEAGREPASVITARTLADGQLLLTDSKAKIRLASRENPLGCHLRGEHAAICREPRSFPIGLVKIRAGANGDVIDARFVSCDSVTLEGGPGNDTLLAPLRVPNEWGRATVSGGGGGHNLMVGNDHTSVSYGEARGPVTVNLLRGFGIARGEHDRIVGITGVQGSDRAHNTIIGSRSAGDIWGGARGNLIVTRSRNTTVDFEQPLGKQHALPSTIVCLQPSPVLSIEPSDIALGHCQVGYMRLRLPMRSPDSAVLTLKPARGEEAERHVELLAGPAHTLVGQLNYPPTSAPTSIPCRLNAIGQEMLREKGTLDVIVKELYSWPPHSGPSQLWKIFTTVLISV
jgi:hypothetical protein